MFDFIWIYFLWAANIKTFIPSQESNAFVKFEIKI